MTDLEKAGRFVRLIGWITLIFLGIAFVGISLSIIIPAIATKSFNLNDLNNFGFIYFIIILFSGFSIFELYVGSSIKENKKWAKITGFILGVLNLISFPIGTIFGSIILYYLVKGWRENNQSTSTI